MMCAALKNVVPSTAVITLKRPIAQWSYSESSAEISGRVLKLFEFVLPGYFFVFYARPYTQCVPAFLFSICMLYLENDNVSQCDLSI